MRLHVRVNLQALQECLNLAPDSAHVALYEYHRNGPRVAYGVHFGQTVLPQEPGDFDYPRFLELGYVLPVDAIRDALAVDPQCSDSWFVHQFKAPGNTYATRFSRMVKGCVVATYDYDVTADVPNDYPRFIDQHANQLPLPN